MGAYSPLPWAPDGLVDEVVATCCSRRWTRWRAAGTPFSGLLYAGLALTSRGLRVIEFNARFGDPETQVVLARLRTPLGGLLLAAADRAAARGRSLDWSDEAAVTVVVAAHGYPAAPRTGDEVHGLESAAGVEGASVLHAGTGLDASGRVVSSGGRVLSVVGTGADLAAARSSAYAAVDRIDLAGSHYRTDIAATAADDERRRTVSEREVLTWADFGSAGRELAQQVVDDGYRPDLILTIARGGLLPAGRSATRSTSRTWWW